MKVINFKKAIETLGYTIVKYNKGYNYRSAFATDKNNSMFYFNIEDLRDEHPILMYRTATDVKDYRGGINRYDMENKLYNLGYIVKENRTKCDYNSN
jgi:hypothetical protein